MKKKTTIPPEIKVVKKQKTNTKLDMLKPTARLNARPSSNKQSTISNENATRSKPTSSKKTLKSSTLKSVIIPTKLMKSKSVTVIKPISNIINTANIPIQTPSVCSPSAYDNYMHHKSCLTESDIRSLGALYNSRKPTDPIPQEYFNDIKMLHGELDKRFVQQPCGRGNEHCWLEDPIVKTSDMYQQIVKRFRPKKPSSWESNPRQWLNTLDILEVMKQYEELHPSFQFHGVFPSDFMKTYSNSDVCIGRHMCGFDVDTMLKNGKSSFGIVFNLDKHDQPGSHWTAAFADFDKENKTFGMCYYDSMGSRPPTEIFNFLKEVRGQSRQVFNEQEMSAFDARYNNSQHQYKYTECGMFSMAFIILCLEYLKTNVGYRGIRDMIGPKSDDDVHKLRNRLYRPVAPLNVKI